MSTTNRRIVHQEFTMEVDCSKEELQLLMQGGLQFAQMATMTPIQLPVDPLEQMQMQLHMQQVLLRSQPSLLIPILGGTSNGQVSHSHQTDVRGTSGNERVAEGGK